MKYVRLFLKVSTRFFLYKFLMNYKIVFLKFRESNCLKNKLELSKDTVLKSSNLITNKD